MNTLWNCPVFHVSWCFLLTSKPPRACVRLSSQPLRLFISLDPEKQQIYRVSDFISHLTSSALWNKKQPQPQTGRPDGYKMLGPANQTAPPRLRSYRSICSLLEAFQLIRLHLGGENHAAACGRCVDTDFESQLGPLPAPRVLARRGNSSMVDRTTWSAIWLHVQKANQPKQGG